MADFLTPEEEFEMMHADELELMREMEAEMGEPNDVLQMPSQARRQLPVTDVPHKSHNSSVLNGTIGNCSQMSFNNEAPTTPHAALNSASQTRISPSTLKLSSIDTESSAAETGSHKRRLMSDELQDMDELWGEEPIIAPAKRRKPLVPEVRGCDDSIIGQSLRHVINPDLAIIERIMKHRERNNQAMDSASNATATLAGNMGNNITVHKRIPLGAFQAITGSEGKRFYLSMDEDTNASDDDELHAANDNEPRIPMPQRQLLNTPFSFLKAAAQRELQRQAVRVVRAAEAQAAAAADLATAELTGVDDRSDADSELWTDLYRPSQYLHLLSDEMTNRTVLYWVKMWDKCVFGIERKQRKRKEPSQQNNFKFQDSKFNKFNNNQFNNKVLNDLRDEIEKDGRPSQKLVLLCGPPGLGKTTLAHVIASHAGYNVVELNASDDRSLDAFRSTIENATSMRSVLDKDRRPNCLIIDEIDGAPAPSIKLLVNLITGKGLGGKGATKKGAKEKVFVLQRPVIAICNDLYTPALRPLRQHALVITFPPTLSSRLAQRLLEISRERGLRADLTALMTLARKTHNDIRSCLSLLQFVKSKRSQLALKDVDSASVGQKDYQMSLFAVWQNIFSIPRAAVKGRRVNPHEASVDGTPSTPPNALAEEPCNTMASRYRDVLQAAQSCSEYDRLLAGWFENYPNSKFKHTHLEPVTNGLDWAAFQDMIMREIHTTQNWRLQGYLPHVSVAFHMNFASLQKLKITFPAQQTDLLLRSQKNEALLTTLMQNMSPNHRVFVAPRMLLTDLLPYLHTIVQPNFRAVNTQLYSTAERAQLLSLINTMLAYNLTYAQEKSPEGQYSFIMEPNIEEIIKLDVSTGSNNTGSRKQLSYTARQLVAREVEMERVRRAETYFSEQEQQKKIIPNREKLMPMFASKTPSQTTSDSCTGANVAAGTSSGNTSRSSNTDGQEDKDESNVPNHLRKLKAKPVIKKIAAATVARDFFGRVIQLTAAQREKAEATTNEIVKSAIWFRFKEGYSNAVRRNIKLRDLA